MEESPFPGYGFSIRAKHLEVFVRPIALSGLFGDELKRKGRLFCCSFVQSHGLDWRADLEASRTVNSRMEDGFLLILSRFENGRLRHRLLARRQAAVAFWRQQSLRWQKTAREVATGNNGCGPQARWISSSVRIRRDVRHAAAIGHRLGKGHQAKPGTPKTPLEHGPRIREVRRTSKTKGDSLATLPIGIQKWNDDGKSLSRKSLARSAADRCLAPRK